MEMKPKKLRIGGLKKTEFSNPPIFNFGIYFLSSKHANLKKLSFFESTNSQSFLLHPHENQAQIMGWHRWDSIFMIAMVSSKFLGVRINLLHSVYK